MNKTKLLLTITCALLSGAVRGQNIGSMPPVVVKTVPESGVRDVAPGETEIRVTFSKEMRNGSWSWSTAWQDSSPETVGKPKYDADGKTCIMKVKLEPHKTYAYWINSSKFTNFRDKEGHSAVPYLLIFETKDQ
ncbi:MAG TPA: Ig-like domain-containing protein [Candidatus Saccharimonadales bacterium]|nr:Ig-like domain-containing protein [Candidatus Saccharimonadales bacterium]